MICLPCAAACAARVDTTKSFILMIIYKVTLIIFPQSKCCRRRTYSQ